MTRPPTTGRPVTDRTRTAAGSRARAVPPAVSRPDAALYRRDWAYALWQILASMGDAFVPRFPEEFGDDPYDHGWRDDSGWSDAR